MSKLVKKFAFVSTSFYDRDGEGRFKSFHITLNDLTEEDVLIIKKNCDLYDNMWSDLYNLERENAKIGVYKDLRPELEIKIKGLIEDKLSSEYMQHFSIKDCREAWLEKDLIIENYLIEEEI